MVSAPWSCFPHTRSAHDQQVLAGVLGAPQHVDVLVVDDSSPDGTGEMVRGRSRPTEPRLRLLERERKAGLASAYLEGFALGLNEGYDLVVEMDSDLSHDPSELPSLLAAAAEHDLTVGSRYIPGGSVSDWSRVRVALSRAGNLYARVMLGIPIHDATSGFRAYRNGLLKELTARAVPRRRLRLPDRTSPSGMETRIRARRSADHVPRARARESKISRRIVAEALWLVTKWGLRPYLRAGRLRVMYPP